MKLRGWIALSERDYWEESLEANTTEEQKDLVS